MKNQLKYNMMAAGASLIWASAFAGAKVGFAYMPPTLLSGFRFMLAGLLIVPFLIKRRVDWAAFRRQWAYLLFFAAFQTTLQYWLFYEGLYLVPAAVSSVIVGLSPIFVTILAHIFLGAQDRLSLRKIIAIIFGFCGVIFISISSAMKLHGGPLFYWGCSAMVLSSLTGSITNIIVASRKEKLDPIALNAISCFVGGVFLTLIAFPTEREAIAAMEPLSFAFWTALLWIAVIPASAFSIWYYLLNRPDISVSEINIMKFLIPVFGVILSWLIVREEAWTWNSAIGALVIAIAIIIVQMPEKKRAA